MTATTGYSYGYDQLNRLVEMRQHSTGTTSGWSNSSIVTAYRESISYDANGNILKYLRKGHSGTPHMDSLTYQYNYSSGKLINNRLNHVSDSIPAGNYSEDIDDQDAGNYQYDYIGNLRADGAEKIDTIRWTVYGKINRIVKSEDNVSIDYSYDAAGNRTRKRVNNNDTISITWYVRDAQGNVMAVYSNKEGTEDIVWKEQHLYGSSRLGMWRADTTVPAAPPVVDEDPVYDSVMLGSRTYELTNHLGNVLATISDKKIGNDSSDVVNYYIAEVLSQTDYYPGGMLMDGRSYSAGTGYRYGFNGKEKDNEVVQYDYGFRIYDPRLVRFKSVDPLTNSYPWYTPYQFAGNKMINCIDVDGLEDKEVIHWITIGLDGNTTIKTLTQEHGYVIGNRGKGTLVTYIVDRRRAVKNDNYGKKGNTGPRVLDLPGPYEKHELFEPAPKRGRGGLVLYTVGPGPSGGGMGSEGEADGAVDVSGILAAAGVVNADVKGIGRNDLETFTNTLSNIKNAIDVADAVNLGGDIENRQYVIQGQLDKLKEKLNEKDKPVAQDNTTPGIKPVKNTKVDTIPWTTKKKDNCTVCGGKNLDSNHVNKVAREVNKPKNSN